MIYPNWSGVVDRINQDRGSAYRLVCPLSGGRQGGAWILTDERGREGAHGVLTWTVNPGLAVRRHESAWLVQQLHLRGYPTPQWRAWGTFEDGLAYVIADHVPGTPASWADLSAKTLIDAVERQAGLALPAAASWSDYLRESLSENTGPRGAVAALGDDGLPFLHLINQAIATLGDTALPHTDAVHGDLEASNILMTHPRDADGGIAIVDIDACGAGTRAIDYAWLFRDATAHNAPASTTRRLREAGIAVAGPEVWATCVAFACLELVGFVARSGNRSGAAAEIRILTPMLHGLSTQ